jgi:lysyl-tRNA synthetase class 2
MLRARARLLAEVRKYFTQHDVLEVETPILNPSTVTDPNIESVVVSCPKAVNNSESVEWYLRTSPEYAMKGLLANGSGSIYQIGKVFRAEEEGRFHSREFTMLEWYRVSWTYHELMDEMQILIQRLCDGFGVTLQFERQSYSELFRNVVGFDPIVTSIDELKQQAKQKTIPVDVEAESWSKDELLDLFLSHSVSDYLAEKDFVFVYDYPASQAALAKLHPENNQLAQRFELFGKGIELANGFQELTDAVEQRKRFERDNQIRSSRGQKKIPVDEALIQALETGLPECAGVALGLDRLLMLLASKTHIKEVL